MTAVDGDGFYLYGEDMNYDDVGNCLYISGKTITQTIKIKRILNDGSYFEGQCQNGKLEGLAKSYYKGGKLHAEKPYKNDKKEGAQKVYRKSGKLGAVIAYKNDEPVSGICHKTDGQKIPLTNAELTNWKNGYTITCE